MLKNLHEIKNQSTNAAMIRKLSVAAESYLHQFGETSSFKDKFKIFGRHTNQLLANSIIKLCEKYSADTDPNLNNLISELSELLFNQIHQKGILFTAIKEVLFGDKARKSEINKNFIELQKIYYPNSYIPEHLSVTFDSYMYHV